MPLMKYMQDMGISSSSKRRLLILALNPGTMEVIPLIWKPLFSRMNEYERRNNEYLARMEIEIYGSEYNIQ